MIIPSIIGYGFSDYPDQQGFVFNIIEKYDRLMTEGLGYSNMELKEVTGVGLLRPHLVFIMQRT